MQKKKTQTKTTRSQRAWIGIGVIAVIAVALLFGLGALSIQPTTGKTGKATVSFFTRDGTQVNASESLIEVYVCNYSTANNIEQYVADFGNYEAVELNSSNFKDLNLEIDIKANTTVMAKIKEGNGFFSEWFQILPGHRNVILNGIPDAAGMSSILISLNETHAIGKAFVGLYDVNDSIITQNKNHSVPAFIDMFENNTRVYLMIKFDATTDYTTKAMNISLGETYIYDGDLYIRLNIDLISFSEFEFVIDPMAMDDPPIFLVYADLEFTTITTLFEINEYM